MNKSKLLIFTGVDIYVGIDVHLKSWKVTIYGEEFELKTFSQKPDSKQLASSLHKLYPGATIYCVYEAGFSGFGLCRDLCSMGINCKLIHPADVPTSDKEKKHKTDRIDSRKLARGLKNGDLTGIHVPDQKQEQDRSLVRVRDKLVRNRTRVMNRIKFYLMQMNIDIPETFKERSWSRSFMNWLSETEFAYTSAKAALQLYINEYQHLTEQVKQATGQVGALSKTDDYRQGTELLMSIPGIGMLSAITLLTEIGDINRFDSLKKLCSYFGLIPNTHSSGETRHDTGITPRGNRHLKYVLIECAWIAMRKDPALYLYYKKVVINKNKKENKAIVKIARKLLNRIRYVLRNQKPYVLHVIQ